MFVAWTSIEDGRVLYCRCCQAEIDRSPGSVSDLAVLTEQCRQHEIASHSTTVSPDAFRFGYEVGITDPDWWKRFIRGDLGIDELGKPMPMKYVKVAFEWLDEPEDMTASTSWICVRDPKSLTGWLGPERVTGLVPA